MHIVALMCIYLIFLKVFSEYFKELEEESIRDNFVIIYELMDELMDFGYPQTTDSKILQEWVFFTQCISLVAVIVKYELFFQLLFKHNILLTQLLIL